MGTVPVEIPDNIEDRVLDAVADRHGYDSGVDGTKGAFAKTAIEQWLKRITVEYEAAQGSKAASELADSEINFP